MLQEKCAPEYTFELLSILIDFSNDFIRKHHS